MRFVGDGAERADRIAILGDQRRASIEAYERRVGDEGVVAKARIVQRVADDQGRCFGDCVSAERGVARCLVDEVCALKSLEPLSVAIDERDEADRRVADGRDDAGEVVEAALRCGVEELVAVEGREALLFVFGEGRFHRGGDWCGRSPRARDARVKQTRCINIVTCWREFR